MSDVTLQAAFGGMIDRQKRGINEARAKEAVQNEVAFSPYEVEWHEQQHGGWYGLTSPTGHAEQEYEASVRSSYIASRHIESNLTPYSMFSSQSHDSTNPFYCRKFSRAARVSLACIHLVCQDILSLVSKSGITSFDICGGHAMMLEASSLKGETSQVDVNQDLH